MLLAGKKFGQLMVLQILSQGRVTRDGPTWLDQDVWLCECECGNICFRRTDELNEWSSCINTRGEEKDVEDH